MEEKLAKYRQKERFINIIYSMLLYYTMNEVHQLRELHEFHFEIIFKFLYCFELNKVFYPAYTLIYSNRL